MRVLIAGCGYVGTALGRELTSVGHEVWGLRRNPGALPGGIRPVAADLLRDDLAALLPAVDRVVYAVAADGPREEAYEDAYVTGPRRLLSALRDRGDGWSG
jgi:nucleoside-diphosphate-sugar epimerase